jgi:hypothetical protein
MKIIKNSVQLLTGVLMYLFVFSVGDILFSPEVLKKYIVFISIFLILAGFFINILLNRFLFGNCIIRAIVYSFLSFLILFGTSFILRGML